MCVCVRARAQAHVHTFMPVQRSEDNLLEVASLFPLYSCKCHTQVISLVGKCLYQLVHLTTLPLRVC